MINPEETMKTIATLVVVAGLAVAGAASTRSFTGTYKNDPAVVIVVPGPTPAPTIQAAHFKSVGTAATGLRTPV
jgi:hypothetical protein